MKKVEIALQTIQQKLIAPKDKYNSFGKYKYRSAEGILNAVKPLLDETKSSLLLTDEIKQVGPFTFCESTAELICENESIIVKSQAGIPESKKGMDLSQIFGTSSSYARKYALNGLFLIDDTKDADTDEHANMTTKTSNDDENKPWLNKNTPEFEKAKKFVENGGEVSKIRTKFKVSKAVEAELLKDILNIK